MSRVERKEYQETKIMRTVSPVRGTRGSSQNLVEFDQNLDNLLEDLQSSVSRPSSSLGHTNANSYREVSKHVNNYDTARTNSLNRVTHLKASNPVTEYSSDDSYSYTSPDGTRSVKTYKKESYSYQTSKENISPERVRMQDNINQLDSLLDDLQQTKQTSSSSYNSIGGDPSFRSNSGNKLSSSTKTVQRELHYGDTPRTTSRTQTIERYEREGSIPRDVQYSSEGSYGEIKTLRNSSPSPSRTSTLSKQTKVTNVHSYPVEIVETTTPDINPEILANLDPALLPSGNTKVTTTIKTYTYEIPGPGSGYPSQNSSIETTAYSPNTSQTTPSKSFVYNKVENNTRNVNYSSQEPGWNVLREVTTNNVIDNQPPYKKPSSPINDDRTLIKETITTRNYQPGYRPDNQPGKQTYVYNETTTTRNINDNAYPANRYPGGQTPPPQPGQTTYIVKETHNTTTNRNVSPYSNGYPPQNQPNQTTIIYKQDSQTNNTTYPNRPNTPRDIETFDPNYPPYPDRRRPNEPMNVTYKYTSHTSTTNNVTKGYPPESEPLLGRPFPTDNDVDGPPKKLDDLMAKIGGEPPNSPYNASFNQHEAEIVQQKKVDSLKQQNEDLQKKEAKDLPRTKNVTGPPVYYPPGHEMFAKKEESGAWRAEGGMSKEKGKYKYEAESKSKSKSSSGAAIVPVCLPLCCGLPCTIL